MGSFSKHTPALAIKMDLKSVKIPNVLKAKVCVVGESGIGKTAICHQITSDGTDFPKNYIVTQLSEISVKTIKIPDTNDIVELYLIVLVKIFIENYLKKIGARLTLLLQFMMLQNKI